MNAFQFSIKPHIGDLIATVKKGDHVKRGQCIAEPIKFGTKLHSSISGEILEVNKESIHIHPELLGNSDFRKIKNCQEIWEYAYEAGLVGAGGAGFPTHVKLQTKIPGGYIVANGVECEPGFKHNIKRMEEHPDSIVEGINYAMISTGATSAYLGIKEKNTLAIKTMQEAIVKSGFNIQIFPLPHVYPMGEERALLHSIFGKWLSPSELPTSLQCVVMNVETLHRLALAVNDRKPFIDKDFTIMGDFLDEENSTAYLDLPIGIPISEITRGFKSRYPIGEIIIGGPYTGISASLTSSYLEKTSGGVIFTLPIPEYQGPLGLLVCACGAHEDRLRDIATKMKSDIVAVTYCKNFTEKHKCKTPGKCPGQAQGVLYLKSHGAKRIMMSNCNDCSNTVMASAPKLGLGVYHSTDHIFRTIQYPLSRRLKID